MKRWLVAAAALVAGLGVGGGTLVVSNWGSAAQDGYVAARSLPADAVVTDDAIRIETLRLGDVQAQAFTRAESSQLLGHKTGHAIALGQLIQRADLAVSGSEPDRRLVFVALKDVPPVSGGDHVDLLVLSGDADHPSVQPFASGVEVVAVSNGGLVLAVTARQASGLVFAGNQLHLVAVVAATGAAGQEGSVFSADQAGQVFRGTGA